MLICRFFIAIFLIIIYPVTASASKKLSTPVEANTIDTTNSIVVMSSHEAPERRRSCKPIVEAKTTNLGKISIGSSVEINDISFEVGVIKANKFHRDYTPFNVDVAKKDEIICVVAEDSSKLPSEPDCDALWLRIRDCKIID